MIKAFRKISLTFAASLILLLPNLAFAQQIVAQTDLGSFRSIGEFLTGFFTWAIPITGALALIMFIYAGYLYMTSQGNQENITNAKDIIIGVIAGLLLLFTARILLENVIGTIR